MVRLGLPIDLIRKAAVVIPELLEKELDEIVRGTNEDQINSCKL